VQLLIAIAAGAPVVVVCPAGVKGNWVREANTWRKDLFPTMLAGRFSFRWPLPNEVIVTNYDVLPAAMARAPRPGTILIADEAHALKNSKTTRTKRFRALAAQVRAAGGRVWLATGTPILNRAPELWTLLQNVNLAQEAFGSWAEFKRMFDAQKTDHGLRWGTPSGDAAIAIRKVCLRRRRTEVLPDLPTKTHTDIAAEIDVTARALADEALAKAQAAGIDLADLSSWKRIPVAFELMSKLRAALATAKIPAMLEVVDTIEETGEPQVVFSAHRAPIDLLAQRPGWASITGDTSPEQRTRLVYEFQQGRLRGLAVTIRAGGVGLTLTKAHQALFVDLEWTPALNCQAEDRICRIGQDRGCIIRRLIADHELEQRVAAKLLEKQRLIEATVEQAAVGEGRHTDAVDAQARELQGVLAQVTTAPVPVDLVRRAPVVRMTPRAGDAAAAVVPPADECPF
jgi:SNF2 family DNA or RNA helicase